MPAVAINSGNLTGDENTNVGQVSFGTGFGFTVNAASNTELVCLVTFRAAITGLTMAYGGQAMTLLNPGGTAITSTNCGFTYIFHKTAPLTGAQNLTASWTTSTDFREAHIAFDNAVGGVNFYSNSGSSATASVAITTGGTTDAAIAMFQNISANGFTAAGQGASETQMYAPQTDGIINNVVNYIVGTGASSQTMSNTLGASDNWAAAGVDIRNVAAVAPFIFGKMAAAISSARCYASGSAVTERRASGL
jgi:hypothetical protein